MECGFSLGDFLYGALAIAGVIVAMAVWFFWREWQVQVDDE